jgi:chloramphenicol-sensitive protein RarD
VTTAPLLFFAYGARQVDFVTLGMLQYIVPSVQFAIGVAVFHEPFRSDRWLAFGMIWLAVALYTAGGLRALPRRAVP